MTPNPLSIRQNATVKEAAAFLSDRGISAAPVIDDAGRAVGVLSRADIVVHHRQEAQFVPEFSTTMSGQTWPCVPMSAFAAGFQVENVDPSQVRDIMTPVVLAVSLNDSARKVLREWWTRKCTVCSWWTEAMFWWASSAPSMCSVGYSEHGSNSEKRRR